MNSSRSSKENIPPKANLNTSEEYRYKTVNIGLFLIIPNPINLD